VSLFTLHVIWPFLWIWSTLYREDRGWGFGAAKGGAGPSAELDKRVAELSAQVQALQADMQRATTKTEV